MNQRVPDPDIAHLAQLLHARLDLLAEQLTGRIFTEIDFYRTGGVVEQDDVRRTVRNHYRDVLRHLSTGARPDLSVPQRTGRVRAEQGAPLPEVLRAYRLGFAFLWEQLVAEAGESGARTVRGLLDTATVIWALADDHSLALTEAYRQAVAERMLEADRRRSALVQALINGGVSDHVTSWEVAKLLDLPFEGCFMVVVAENTTLGTDPMPGVEGRLRTLDVRSAWRLQPDFEVGVLSCSRRRPLETVTRILGDLAQARIGVSPAYSKLSQTPRALRFAQVAMEALPRGRKGVRQLDDTPLWELLIGNPETTQRVARRVLGAILTLPADERTMLLSTLQAWLDARGSATDAGRTLFCHPNTVRHRLRRLTELTGRSLDDPKAVTELTAALQALQVLPTLAGDGVATLHPA